MTQISPQIAASLAHFHRCVADGDMTTLGEILADNVCFRSPFLWKPKEGKELIGIALSAASRVFEDFAYHREMTDGTTWVLEFSARVGEFSLKGVDIIRFNAEGRIEDFEVMVRPFKGLQALSEAMGRQMAAQGALETFMRG
ncbi:MAG TPA: nuclear transport factor 2 family protein [Blastocatellia bacterium]|nr:nuclear transport factor 2 family protein [Blastocatellia bacterium]